MQGNVSEAPKYVIKILSIRDDNHETTNNHQTELTIKLITSLYPLPELLKHCPNARFSGSHPNHLPLADEPQGPGLSECFPAKVPDKG